MKEIFEWVVIVVGFASLAALLIGSVIWLTIRGQTTDEESGPMPKRSGGFGSSSRGSAGS